MTTSATKDELAKALHEKLQITKRDAALAVDAIFDAMTTMLVEGREVKIANFGKFVLLTRRARKGKNPKTGADVDVPESKFVRLRPSSVLHEKVNAP